MTEQLDWVHDCALISIQYEASDSATRSLAVTLRCPPDLGLAAWAGKTLIIFAVGVAAVKLEAWSIVADGETMEAIREGVSPAMDESTAEARRMGIEFPGTRLTFVFQSGSSLEVICETVQIKEAADG